MSCLQSPPGQPNLNRKEKCTTKEYVQHHPDEAASGAGFLAMQKTWWDPRLGKQEWHEELLQWPERHLKSLHIWIITTPQYRWLYTHHQQRQNPWEWVEHFDNVLSCLSFFNGKATDYLPQLLVNKTLDAVPTFEEIQKTICLLSSGKAGSDSIQAEIYKEGNRALTDKLHQLF